MSAKKNKKLSAQAGETEPEASAKTAASSSAAESAEERLKSEGVAEDTKGSENQVRGEAASSDAADSADKSDGDSSNSAEKAKHGAATESKKAEASAKGEIAAEEAQEADDDEDEDGGIDWLTIILMIAVMVNIGYWIWVRDNVVTGDVEMHRPPGINGQIAGSDPNGAPPGPNAGKDAFGREVLPRHVASMSADQQDMVRTYIIIANALEIAGYGEVRSVWELDKQVMDAARDNRGLEEEMRLTKLAYAEALKVMRTCYSNAFAEEAKKSNAEAKKAAEKIFADAVELNDKSPLEAMARYEDALLRLRADGILNSPNQPMPPAANGQPMPPAANGQPMPPAANGQPMPPAANGQPMPPAVNGPPMPPAANGQPMPPAVNGQPMPPAANGQPMPPAVNGQPMPPAVNGQQAAPAQNGQQEPARQK